MTALRIDRRGDVAWLWLCRPHVRNAFDAALVAELAAAFASFDATVRVVVLAGEGPAFCAGADATYMKESAAASASENREEAGRMAAMFAAIDAAPQVVLARVQGPALGGGAGLVACADIAVAAQGARFGFPEVRLGLAPAVISPFVIAKIGSAAARRYFLTGELFDASVAARLSLVHEVVAAEELDPTLERLCAALLAGGPQAQAAAKRLVHAVRGRPAAAVTEETTALIATLRGSAEGQEGLAAFLEKRPARWS